MRITEENFVCTHADEKALQFIVSNFKAIKSFEIKKFERNDLSHHICLSITWKK